MSIEALLAAAAVAAASLVGGFFFGSKPGLVGIERYSVPVAVGVFLSLVLYELIPKTLESAPQWGGVAVAAGFISFYVLAQVLHNYFHKLGEQDCDRKGAATLLLIGDGIHNFADGIILGGAFLIDPTIGVATAIGLALHEIPQEIVEFGILLRAGYTKRQAALRNLLSASTIILGTFLVMVLSQQAEELVWVLLGVAAGNLLFLAASDLLPRIHGNLRNYGNIWYATGSIIVGFVVMTSVLSWTHETFGHGHEHEADHSEEEHSHDGLEADHVHTEEEQIKNIVDSIRQ